MGLKDNFDHLPLNFFFEFRKFQKQMDFLIISSVRLVVNKCDNYLMRDDTSNTIRPFKATYCFTHRYDRILVCVKGKKAGFIVLNPTYFELFTKDSCEIA